MRVKAYGHSLNKSNSENRTVKISPKVWWIIWISSAIILLLTLAAVIIPSARIVLTPLHQNQTFEFDVHASSAVKTVDIIGVVPLNFISTNVKSQDNLMTSGQMQIPDEVATGVVRFTNLTDRIIEIPSGTVIMTYPQKQKSSIKFSTKEAIKIPANYVDALKTTQSIDVSVQAQIPGSDGNLPADSLVVVEEPLGYDVSVTNPQPTGGGTEQTVAVPTEKDRDLLYKRLYAALEQQARVDLQYVAHLNEEKIQGILLSESPILNRVVEKTYIPEGDAPAENLVLILQLEFGNWVVFGKDLERLAELVLDANLPSGYTSRRDSMLQTENISIPLKETLSMPNDSVSYRWRMQARRDVFADLPEQQITSLVIGLTPDQAAQRLKERLHIESPPQIILDPPWWRWMPLLPFRITVNEGSGS
jgi:hypothetical protein